MVSEEQAGGEISSEETVLIHSVLTKTGGDVSKTLTNECFLAFSVLCPAEEGRDRGALVGIWIPSGANPPQPSQ